ncbi:MAG: prephenate dehydrogenase [Clostridia bacterium]|nr:prephenate dehydrogenase [Clostridia bacterium]MBQ1965695.1 prephenate dehydrogenase [Clostridia bacterium]MBQ5743269.1 prephenate dehydrogenase [Clostridia bacterium]
MIQLHRDTRILIVGLGLLGGSYAMALKKKGFRCIYGFARRQDTVDYAFSQGLIDEGSCEIDEDLISRAELIVFALYPTVLVRWVEQYGHLIRPGTVVTDVTGVKSCIIDPVVSHLPQGVEFVSVHPMAGKEVGGIENADDSIFHGANYIVVPTEENTEDAIRLCEDLGAELGFARISRLSPKEHDQMIAFLSQLTHCVAVSLMCASDDDRLVQYTGDSFRDLTRIARINDEMWSELFLLNKDALLQQMDAFTSQMERMRDYLASDDREGLREMMRTSTARRAKFDKK